MRGATKAIGVGTMLALAATSCSPENSKALSPAPIIEEETLPLYKEAHIGSIEIEGLGNLRPDGMWIVAKLTGINLFKDDFTSRDIDEIKGVLDIICSEKGQTVTLELLSIQETPIPLSDESTQSILTDPYIQEGLSIVNLCNIQEP